MDQCDRKAPTHADMEACAVPKAWMHHLLLQGTPMDGKTFDLCNKSIKSLSTNFPGAMPDKLVVTLLLRALHQTLPNFSKENTLLGTSFCPDEISNEKGDLPNLLYEEFGKTFHLGGLAGIPFTGKTGFKAFASHVPTNGNVLIVYGPHVAISPDGEVGKFLRPGQDHLTGACGACIGALTAAECGKTPIPLDDEEADADYQMNYITREIGKHTEEIKNHPCGKMAGLAYTAFGLAQRRARAMLDLSLLNGGSLILLGGIQINMSDPLPDFFLPMCCRHYREGQQPVNLEHLLSPSNMFPDGDW